MPSLEQEMLLSTDNFKKPKVLEGKDAIGTLLVRLIQLEPGTYPSRPKMGVGLLSNYRYCDENKALELKDHIRDQIRTYLPEYQAVQVDTKLLSGGKLVIDIVIDQTLYRYETEQETSDSRIVGLHSIL